jgi:YD repeat-containing protein
MRLAHVAKSIVRWLVIVLMLGPMSLLAQQGETTYVYDGKGRLAGVIAPDGEVVVYRYDARGNLIEIKRVQTSETAGKRKGQSQQTPSQSGVVIITIIPNRASVGAQVVIRGAGFIPMPEQNMVAFNGVPTTVSAATPTSLTVTVPEGAKTGPVTVMNPRGIATSFDPFRVLGRIKISPSTLGVILGRSARFTAEVPDSQDQRVTWSIAGIEGGTEALGAISPEGVYRAPTDRLPALPGFESREVKFVRLPVEASSVTEPDVVGEATLLLADNATDLALDVVTVQVGVPRGVAEAAPVSVQVGVPRGIADATPVSVQVGGVRLPTDNVSVATGPVLRAISPTTAQAGGELFMLVIQGANLAAVNDIAFITPQGQRDPNITATIISKDQGRAEATVTIRAAAVPGLRLILVLAAEGRSQTRLIEGVNRFEVTR